MSQSMILNKSTAQNEKCQGPVKKVLGTSFLFILQFTLLAASTRLQLLEEVVALVVNENECGEVFYGNLPYRLHAQLRILNALDALD